MSHENEPVVNLSSDVVVSPAAIMRAVYTAIFLAVTGVVGAVKYAWDANNAWRDIHEEISKSQRSIDQKSQEIHEDIAKVQRTIDLKTVDRWTLSMQRKYSDDVARKNPMFIAPDVDEIATKLNPR